LTKPLSPLQSFIEKKQQFALPESARNALPQEVGTSQTALINPPFCEDNIFLLRKDSRTHSISIISMTFTLDNFPADRNYCI
jgi:hypothetical protein